MAWNDLMPWEEELESEDKAKLKLKQLEEAKKTLPVPTGVPILDAPLPGEAERNIPVPFVNNAEAEAAKQDLIPPKIMTPTVEAAPKKSLSPEKNTSVTGAPAPLENKIIQNVGSAAKNVQIAAETKKNVNEEINKNKIETNPLQELIDNYKKAQVDHNERLKKAQMLDSIINISNMVMQSLGKPGYNIESFAKNEEARGKEEIDRAQKDLARGETLKEKRELKEEELADKRKKLQARSPSQFIAANTKQRLMTDLFGNLYTPDGKEYKGEVKDFISEYQNRNLQHQKFLEDMAIKGHNLKEEMEIRRLGQDAKQQAQFEGSKLLELKKYAESTDPRMKELSKQDIGMDSASDLIKLGQKGNTVAFAALGTKMARAMGEVGPLTDTDVVRYISSPEAARKVADKGNLLIQGKPTKATQEELLAIAQVMRDRFEEKMQRVRNDIATTASRTLGIPMEEAFYKLNYPMPKQSKVSDVKDYEKKLQEYRAAKQSPVAEAPKDSSDKIIVISPDGKKGRIPKSQLNAALAQGYKLP